MSRWHYTGDINLEYGGTFFRFDGWKHGYVESVEVIDLDSAAGFRGAVAIEERSIPIDRPEKWSGALSVIGAELLPNGDISDNGRPLKRDSLSWKMCLAYALQSYGYCDQERIETVQPLPGGPLQFDSWQATRIRSNGLRAYVRREFLGLAR